MWLLNLIIANLGPLIIVGLVVILAITVQHAVTSPTVAGWLAMGCFLALVAVLVSGCGSADGAGSAAGSAAGGVALDSSRKACYDALQADLALDGWWARATPAQRAAAAVRLIDSCERGGE